MARGCTREPRIVDGMTDTALPPHRVTERIAVVAVELEATKHRDLVVEPADVAVVVDPRVALAHPVVLDEVVAPVEDLCLLALPEPPGSDAVERFSQRGGGLDDRVEELHQDGARGCGRVEPRHGEELPPGAFRAGGPRAEAHRIGVEPLSGVVASR